MNAYLLKGGSNRAGEGLFTRAWSDRKREHDIKMKESRVWLDIRKKLFTVRVGMPWERLSREFLDASFLEAFKSRLEAAWSNLVWWKVMTYKVFSNPNGSDFMTEWLLGILNISLIQFTKQLLIWVTPPQCLQLLEQPAGKLWEGKRD